MSAARTGTIVELVPVDGIGWIELDDGQRIRFGGTACKGFREFPDVGTRVIVAGTEPGFRGVLKATMVLPADPPAGTATEEDADSEDESPPVPWPRFVETHPRWSDVERASLSPSFACPPLDLPRHPLFAPWHDEICRTAPVFTGLQIPHFMNQVPVQPDPTMSFAHGTTAFLEGPGWPTCRRCGVPFEMCLQLSPATLAPWLPGLRKGLVAMFCFHCGVSRREDPAVAFVRFVEPRVRVARPAGGPPSASSGHMAQTQLVTLADPHRLPPSIGWYRYRSERTPETASCALFGYGDLRLSGPFPAGALEELDDEELDDDETEPHILEPEDIEAAYEEWLEDLPAGSWGGAKIGGEPTWDQADATPSCGHHGEMTQLVEYDGGQFLDGALHVFLCRTCSALSWVAEL